MPDGVDADVDPATRRRRARGDARVVVVQVHGLGAEGCRHRQPLGHGVDRDHVRRAGGPRGLHGAQADRAEAEHRSDVAGAQAAVDDGVKAGAHDVAGEQRDVVAHALRDLAQHEVGVGHERALGLGALQRAERGAVAEGPRPSHL